MQDAIEAAYMFVVKGLTVEEVALAFGWSGVTKQCVSQKIGRGVNFLLDRRWFLGVS